jgi:biopolymer transport protein ExbD
MAFDAWRRARPETAQVDLIPVMNLFVVMIPFLLLSAAFLHVGVIPASLPGAAGEASEDDSEPTVTMHLDVDDSGVRVRAEHPVLEDEALAGLEAWLPRRGEAHDHDGIAAALHRARSQHADSETLVVHPAGKVDWFEVIAVLDAAREIRLEQDGEDQVLPLFPVVVLGRRADG